MAEDKVKDAILSAIRRKAESMLDTVLAAVDETEETGSLGVTCKIEMVDPIKRTVKLTISGKVAFGMPKEETEASLGSQLELSLDESDGEIVKPEEEPSGQEEPEGSFPEEKPATAGSRSR